MGREQMRNLETYKVGANEVNEFEYQQNQGELTEQQEQQRDQQAGPTEVMTEAERIEQITTDAHQKVEERKRRGTSSFTPKKLAERKSAARNSAKKAASRKSSAKKASTKKSAKKASKKSVAKKSTSRKSATKKRASATRKSGARKSGKKLATARKR